MMAWSFLLVLCDCRSSLFYRLLGPLRTVSKKEGFKKYGDGVLWFQVLEYAKSQKKPIILITDDQKDDWWRIEKGKTLGPRPELVTEISTKGKASFYMYNASQFMKYAKEFLGLQVNQEAIEEVKDVIQTSERIERASLNSVMRRAFYAEDAVRKWLRTNNTFPKLRENNLDYGVDFISTEPNGLQIGIQVKYTNGSFPSIPLSKYLNKLLGKRNSKFENITLILVCEDSNGAIATCDMLRRRSSYPPRLMIIVVFFEEDGSFKSMDTFSRLENS
ncbi:MAG: PIN-like domain-containing protein [Rhabdochlamydiaceae bacterium]